MDGVGSEHSSHLVPIPVRAEPVDPKGGRSPTAAFLFGARKKGQGFDELSPNGFRCPSIAASRITASAARYPRAAIAAWIWSAPFSPIMIAVALVLAPTSDGATEQSATHSPSTP